MLRAPHRAFYFVILIPYLIYALVRFNRDAHYERWHRVLRRAGRLRRLGFDNDSIRYAAGVASARLEEWEPALSEFESIRSQLDEEEEEALRYNYHAWTLHNLGRTGEARTLLEHAVQPLWPTRCRRWAESFLESEEPENEHGEQLLH